MTKSQKKKRIGTLILKYKKILNLNDWDIGFELEKESDNCAAEIRLNAVYKHGTIIIYDTAFEKPNDLDHIIKHELCHCLTETMYVYCMDFLNGRFHAPDDIHDQREILTERIAKILR